jgi:hypothetical protein
MELLRHEDGEASAFTGRDEIKRTVDSCDEASETSEFIPLGDVRSERPRLLCFLSALHAVTPPWCFAALRCHHRPPQDGVFKKRYFTIRV